VHDRAPSSNPAIILFDRSEVNLRTVDVRRDGAPVALQEQPRRILIRLLEASGEIVLREDLRAELWSAQTFVDFEHSLNAAIRRLRDVLGDSADAPRFVETIPRRGYRFIAPISPVTASDAHRMATWSSSDDRRMKTRSSSDGRRMASEAAADDGPKLRTLRRGGAVSAVAAGTLVVALIAWIVVRRTPSAVHAAPAVSPAAYGAYMQGLVASHRWQAGGCPEAEQHLLEAVAIDPNAADAYAHLGYCYVFPDRLRRPGWETGPKARTAVARALALDPRSSLAHVVAGQVSMRHDFDWAAAEREFTRAVALNPNDSEARTAYGELLYASGRHEDGLRALRAALALDPLDMNHQVAFGFALRNLRRFDDAALQFRRTLESDPEWSSARFWLAFTEFDRGRPDDGVREYLDFLGRVVVAERAAPVTGGLAQAYAVGGPRAFWRMELALALEDDAAPGRVWRAPGSYYAGPFAMARRYARLGDKDQAIAWLEKALAYRHHLMVFIGCEPLFDDLRADPRFRDLRRRVGEITD